MAKATQSTETETKPLVQIDDVIREMTDAEFAEYEVIIQNNSGQTPTA